MIECGRYASLESARRQHRMHDCGKWGVMSACKQVVVERSEMEEGCWWRWMKQSPYPMLHPTP